MIAPEKLASLLDLAQATLRDEIQPHLGPQQRYAAAMVASALRMSARALAIGPASASAARQALSALYPGEPSLDLIDLERRLAAELRAGRLTAARERAVRHALLARTVARLAITNPDYIKTYKE
jgi:hypothetical protein